MTFTINLRKKATSCRKIIAQMSLKFFQVFMLLWLVPMQVGGFDKTLQLRRAIEKEDQAQVSSLLQEKGNLNAKDQNGWTPLMFAARQGSLPLVELLIAQGAVVHLKNNEEETALEIANQQGHTKVVLTLLKKLNLRAMCAMTRKVDLPDLIEAEMTMPEDHCMQTVPTSSNATPLDVSGKINIRSNRPIGGLTFLFYEYPENLERLDFTVEFKEFDAHQNFYLQFYQSHIGSAPFYFGIQNRVPQKDRMLLLSRWFDDEEIAEVTGLLEVPECSHFPSMPYDQKVMAYHKFFQENPQQLQKYQTYLQGSVAANETLGGFTQIATYETAFAGIRLPQFPFKQGASYTFTLLKDRSDSVGTWYQYWVTDEETGTKTLVGSIRFPKDAKISNRGQSWTEIYSVLYQKKKREEDCQYYQDLPNMNFTIKALGNDKSPLNFKIQYGPNEKLIPQQRVEYVPNLDHFHFSIGAHARQSAKNQASLP